MSKIEGGLRIKGLFNKRTKLNNPLVSIITIVKNGEKYLEQSIQSVINQSYYNIEYIVIEGDSTDGTLDIIRKYEDRIAYWVSEPDEGIYDAMNKGIVLSTGDYINFMNSGDLFYDRKVVSNVVSEVGEYVDIIYGNALVRYPGGFERPHKATPIKRIMFDLPTPHQALFCKKVLFEKYGLFDASLKTSADFEWFIRILCRAKLCSIRRNCFISINYADGISHNQRFIVYNEHLRAINKYYGMNVGVKYLIRYCLFCVKEPLRLLSKRLHLYNGLVNLKYRVFR